MERYIVTMGDFLKNAGIVGMKYMLDFSKAKENIDYGIAKNKQGLWLSREFILNADWTDMYFKAFVNYFGPSTVYQGIIDKIQSCLEKIDGEWDPKKEEKEAIKFINDKLLSNSYQAGFANIEKKVDKPEVYLELKKSKLSDKMEKTQLKTRLEDIKILLEQPLCKETFTMKSVIYTYINRFWDGKCFLLRANAKKDMREIFEKDFSEPLRKYCINDHKKSKDLCLDCAMPIDTKEKVSIAFMREMADDLTRKKSAFWNCKVDAFLCPLCAFTYALVPLGFQLFVNKFVFVNVNENVMALFSANNKQRKEKMQEKRKEDEKYAAWFARILGVVLSEKTKELPNIQVILRGIQAEDKYMFSIVSKDAINILKEEHVKKALEFIEKHPYVKAGSEFVNVHERVVMNIISYRNQYTLLNQILKLSLENQGVLPLAYWIYVVQIWTGIVRREKKNEYQNEQKNELKKCEKDERRNIALSRIMMRNSGYELRKAIMYARGVDTDDCMRGNIYQLLNALSVKNQEKFMDIVIRMYSSSKDKNLFIPDGFVYMLGNKETFLEYGYAFVLGLKGSHPENENKKNGNKKDEKEKQEEGKE